jgi:hypothetical protein
MGNPEVYGHGTTLCPGTGQGSRTSPSDRMRERKRILTLPSRFNFRGSGKQGTCFQICLKQLRKALEIQGAISDFDLFLTAVIPEYISEVP